MCLCVTSLSHLHTDSCAPPNTHTNTHSISTIFSNPRVRPWLFLSLCASHMSIPHPSLQSCHRDRSQATLSLSISVVDEPQERRSLNGSAGLVVVHNDQFYMFPSVFCNLLLHCNVFTHVTIFDIESLHLFVCTRVHYICLNDGK